MNVGVRGAQTVWMGLAVLLTALGCAHETPPSPDAGAARPFEPSLSAVDLPCQPVDIEPSQPVSLGDDPDIAALWGAAITTLSGTCPFAEGCADVAQGWPFRALPVQRADKSIALLVPGPVRSGSVAHAVDILDLLPIVAPPREKVTLLGYSLDADGDGTRLRVLPQGCSVRPLDTMADVQPGRVLLDVKLAMLSRQLAQLGEVVGVRVSDGGVELLGVPAADGDQVPALTGDDLHRMWRAVANECDCDGQSVNRHACDGAFVSLDPAEAEPFAGAVVALPPCLVDSHLGQVLIEADTLLKELATGFQLATSDPLPPVPGHRTSHDFLVAAAQHGHQPDAHGTEWTRYWLDTSLDRSQQLLQSEDGRVLDVRGFHMSLGVEVTSGRPAGGAPATIDAPHPCADAGDPRPAFQFCREVNEHWERYRSEYPVLRELDRAGRILQAFYWLQETHPEAWSQLRLEELASATVPTPRRVPNLAATSVVLTPDGTSVRSLSHGGVTLGAARVVPKVGRVATAVQRGGLRASERTLLTTIRPRAVSVDDIMLANEPRAMLGLANSNRSVAGALLGSADDTGRVMAATDDAVRALDDIGFGLGSSQRDVLSTLKVGPPNVEEAMAVRVGLAGDETVIGSSVLVTKGAADTSAKAAVKTGLGKMAPYVVPAVLTANGNGGTAEDDEDGQDGIRQNPSRGPPTAPLLPTVTNATRGSDEEEVGGVRIARVDWTAVQQTSLTMEEVVSVTLPHAHDSYEATPRPVVQVTVDDAAQIHTPLVMQREAQALRMGFATLALPQGAIDPSRLRALWPDDRLGVLIPRHDVRGAAALAARIARASRAPGEPRRPIFVVATLSRDVLAPFRATATVHPRSLYRALYAGPGVAAQASWRSVNLATRVPPGPGLLAVGDDAEARAFVLRLARLGRLRGKGLLLAGKRVPDEIWQLLLEQPDPLDHVIWLGGRAMLDKLLSSLRSTTSGTLADWLLEAGAGGVVILGGA